MRKERGKKEQLVNYSYRNEIRIIETGGKCQSSKNDYYKDLDEAIGKIMKTYKELQSIQKEYIVKEKNDTCVKTIDELKLQYRRVVD